VDLSDYKSGTPIHTAIPKMLVQLGLNFLFFIFTELGLPQLNY
jgi:hypothetical protein